MQFTPRPYQTQIIEAIIDRPRVGVWAGMGLGKSVATLTALDALRLVEDAPALVLAPLRVAVSTWPDEARKWDHLRHLKIRPITGSAAQRTQALFGPPADVYTMNYENLVWLVEALADAGRGWPFATVVADEATRLKSFRLGQGGKRARALGKVAHTRINRFIELTGTPSPNGLTDLWGQAWFLDKGERLGRSYGAFASRWFQSIPTADGYSMLKPFNHAQKEIEEKLSDICFAINPKDHFDLRDPIVNVIKVDLPVKARAQYRQMEREMFAEINGHEIEAVSAAARTMKCLQLANGAAYTDDQGNWTEAHDVKLQALDEIIEEASGAPVLVAYHFKSDLARLKKRFPHGRHLDADPKTIRDWNAGKIGLLFAHPASAGHGLNLQDGGNILAFFGHWWDLEQHQQIIERIGPARQAQAGYDRPVFIHHIVARDTVDELVLERIRTKRSVQDLLLEAMKERT